MHATIEAISSAWDTAPKSILHSHGEGVVGARWLCGGIGSKDGYVAPRFAGVHVISLILRRFTGECWLDGKPFYTGRVSANRLRILPAGHAPSWRAQGPVEMFHLYVPDSVLRRQLALLGYRVEPQATVLRPTAYVSDPLLQQMMYRLAVTAGASGRLHASYLQKLEETLVLHLLSHYASDAWIFPGGPAGDDDSGIMRAASAIDEHLRRHLPINALAEIAELSASQFNRRFQQATGFTPHQYRLHRRIEAAKLRLARGNESLAAIAHDLGFSDQAHFTRAFRQFAGVTPGEYMANNAPSRIVTL